MFNLCGFYFICKWSICTPGVYKQLTHFLMKQNNLDSLITKSGKLMIAGKFSIHLTINLIRIVSIFKFFKHFFETLI